MIKDFNFLQSTESGKYRPFMDKLITLVKNLGHRYILYIHNIALQIMECQI